jgi:hypothetical protein
LHDIVVGCTGGQMELFSMGKVFCRSMFAENAGLDQFFG